MKQSTIVLDILEFARWAPSGDNTQPWRFEIVDDHHFIIHAFDTRQHCVYDLDGHPSQIAHGALIETLCIAASAYQLRAEISRQPGSSDYSSDYVVTLIEDSTISPDPLLPYIKQRSVQRRPMRTSPLSKEQIRTLEAAVGNLHSVRWFAAPLERWRFARLMFSNAKLRLTIPEAYAVHRDIIEWQARFSEDRVPDQALGLDAMTLKLMRWVMASWQRVRFFNTWLAGHLTPRIEMDLLPGGLCAAHFVIVAQQTPRNIDDYVAAGRVVQRFWLTATRLGLQLQPELTPLIFSRYVREQVAFSGLPSATTTATRLGQRLAELIGSVPIEQIAFMGRIGTGKSAHSRSLRRPLQGLLKSSGTMD
jgi:hypothetical protein